MKQLWIGYYITQSVTDPKTIGHGLSIDFDDSKESFIGGFYNRIKSKGKLKDHTLITMEAVDWNITKEDWEKLQLIAKEKGW